MARESNWINAEIEVLLVQLPCPIWRVPFLGILEDGPADDLGISYAQDRAVAVLGWKEVVEAADTARFVQEKKREACDLESPF